MDKKKKTTEWRRHRIQALWALLTNSYLAGFVQGKIYRGPLKKLCVPGLNCYSCPGALGSCPIGAMQAVIGSWNFKFAFYVAGFLMFIGALTGRFVCGWLCPFGLIQEDVYKRQGSPNKKGGRGIATIKIFACDAADHLAGRSIKRFKDGGAQSVCHSAFADDGISVWLLETERCMYHNGCIGGGAECALADLSGDSCSFVYIQSDVKNRGDGTDQKNAGGRFKRSESTGLNYRMGVR